MFVSLWCMACSAHKSLHRVFRTDKKASLNDNNYEIRMFLLYLSVVRSKLSAAQREATKMREMKESLVVKLQNNQSTKRFETEAVAAIRLILKFIYDVLN